MNHQEIFNRVATHLITQGYQCNNHQGCAYRGDDGARCAIGCLIPDELYTPQIEGIGVSSLFRMPLEWHSVLRHICSGPPTEEDIIFLGELQGIHDGHLVAEWPDRLRGFATSHSLTLPPCLQ